MDFSGRGKCTCGKDLTGCGGSFGGVLNYSARECSCGISVVYYSAREGYEVSLQVTKKEPEDVSRV